MEVGCCRVHVGRRAYDAERLKPLALGHKEEDRGETEFYREYTCVCCREGVRGRSLDLMQKGVQSGHSTCTRRE